MKQPMAAFFVSVQIKALPEDLLFIDNAINSGSKCTFIIT